MFKGKWYPGRFLYNVSMNVGNGFYQGLHIDMVALPENSTIYTSRIGPGYSRILTVSILFTNLKWCQWYKKECWIKPNWQRKAVTVFTLKRDIAMMHKKGIKYVFCRELHNTVSYQGGYPLFRPHLLNNHDKLKPDARFYHYMKSYSHDCEIQDM